MHLRIAYPAPRILQEGAHRAGLGVECLELAPVGVEEAAGVVTPVAEAGVPVPVRARLAHAEQDLFEAQVRHVLPEGSLLPAFHLFPDLAEDHSFLRRELCQNGGAFPVVARDVGRGHGPVENKDFVDEPREPLVLLDEILADEVVTAEPGIDRRLSSADQSAVEEEPGGLSVVCGREVMPLVRGNGFFQYSVQADIAPEVEAKRALVDKPQAARPALLRRSVAEQYLIARVWRHVEPEAHGPGGTPGGKSPVTAGYLLIGIHECYGADPERPGDPGEPGWTAHPAAVVASADIRDRAAFLPVERQVGNQPLAFKRSGCR